MSPLRRGEEQSEQGRRSEGEDEDQVLQQGTQAEPEAARWISGFRERCCCRPLWILTGFDRHEGNPDW